jgi:hypothetical protein
MRQFRVSSRASERHHHGAEDGGPGVHETTLTNVTDLSSACPPPPHLQFSDYCEGAGQPLPLPRFSFASRAARGGGVRITRLNVSGLDFPPPYADPAVAVFCYGPRRVGVRDLRGCPFGARFFARPPGGVQRIDSFGRRVLRPGIVIEVWIVKGNYIGRVQRLVVERRRLAASSRCIHPTRVLSHACPSGS